MNVISKLVGTVYLSKGKAEPICGISIRIFQKKQYEIQLLGTVTTDSDGCYSIAFFRDYYNSSRKGCEFFIEFLSTSGKKIGHTVISHKKSDEELIYRDIIFNNMKKEKITSSDGTTRFFEEKNPSLIKRGFSNMKEFLNYFPESYNLYFPESKNEDVDHDLIMRILPEPASRIYSGVKKYELRKYIPKHAGNMFLMEVGERMEFTGYFYFENYIADEVNKLWDIVGDKSTKKEKFFTYFRNKKYGVALEILKFKKFNNPILVDDLYEKFPLLPVYPHPYVYMYTPVSGELSNILRSHEK